MTNKILTGLCYLAVIQIVLIGIKLVGVVDLCWKVLVFPATLGFAFVFVMGWYRILEYCDQ